MTPTAQSSLPSPSASQEAPRLYLAPMEGVTDWIMRELLTQIGGIDFCVTEFLRITKNLHPKKVFLSHCPELLTGSRTLAGTPVYFQLLGGDPSPMAENASRAAELGAAGIDLNFGCPAKTVNRHDGGAVLLKTPHRLYDTAKAVRHAVPSETPVSGKIRLGFEDPSLCRENVQALAEAGVQWITVHCRTKSQGYRPPAHWEWIPLLQELVPIPVIANGDIDSLERFEQCRIQTQASHFMVGRGALSNPLLFRAIKEALRLPAPSEERGLANPPFSLRPSLEEEWDAHIPQKLLAFYESCTNHINGHFATARMKQWLKFLSLRYPQAQFIFQQVKTEHKPDLFRARLCDAIAQFSPPFMGLTHGAGFPLCAGVPRDNEANCNVGSGI